MIRRPPRSTLFPYTTALPISVGSALSLDAQIDRITGKNFATRSEVLATHGMVCTSVPAATDRKSTRLNSSHANISYAVFCLKKKKLDTLDQPMSHYLN